MKLSKEQKAYRNMLENALSTTLERAWTDENFKQELISAPMETIERFTGEKLNFPKHRKLIVTDQTDNNAFYFNITSRPTFKEANTFIGESGRAFVTSFLKRLVKK